MGPAPRLIRPRLVLDTRRFPGLLPNVRVSTLSEWPAGERQ